MAKTFLWCDCWSVTTSYVVLPNGSEICSSCYNDVFNGVGKAAEFLNVMTLTVDDFVNFGFCREGVIGLAEIKKISETSMTVKEIVNAFPKFKDIIINCALLKWDMSE